jgi:hypothetical protein
MAIDLNGSTGISLDDNEKINIGNDSDLQIYHDGTHSYVADAGGGSLVLSTNGSTVSINTDGPENMAIFRKDSSVDLFHNNSKKFETTSTGITVTGTVAATAVTGDGSGLTGTGSPSIDDNGNATAITIDSSENVMVGKAVTNLGTAGITLGESGFGSFTRSGYEPLNVNRLSSDGAIAKFYKDGTEVGSIGSSNAGERLYMVNDSTGLSFIGDFSNIFPCDSSGTARDNAINLGGVGGRFKDLYLSGGIYLGGAVAANKLDDYEEGTWTPTNPTVTLTSVSGSYTKIGNVVTLHASITVPSTSSGTHFTISGFPFAQKDADAAAGFYMRYTSDSTYRMFYLSNGNNISVYNLGGNATPLSSVSTGRYDFSGVYYTDS